MQQNADVITSTRLQRLCGPQYIGNFFILKIHTCQVKILTFFTCLKSSDQLLHGYGMVFRPYRLRRAITLAHLHSLVTGVIDSSPRCQQ